MTRFQLIFRHTDGDRIEHWDNNHHGEPHVNGKLIVDGETYDIRGVEWILNADGNGRDGTKRFVCTLAVVPESDGKLDVA